MTNTPVSSSEALEISVRWSIARTEDAPCQNTVVRASTTDALDELMQFKRQLDLVCFSDYILFDVSVVSAVLSLRNNAYCAGSGHQGYRVNISCGDETQSTWLGPPVEESEFEDIKKDVVSSMMDALVIAEIGRAVSARRCR